MELRSAGYPAPPGLHAQRGCSARGPFRGSPTRLPRLSWSGSAARWRSPLPGGLPQARSGSRSALITGSPPARLTSRSGWTWTESSTWLKYLGPGRGGSLLEGRLVCAELANRGVKDVLIVEGAPPARERSARGNVTGTPACLRRSRRPGPRRRSRPVWST